ncbi:MAG: acyl-CoA thioesterase [Balneolaceae bacterium]|nr:acyl-CoA thioesterase [Balneolaceae bacterium]
MFRPEYSPNTFYHWHEIPVRFRDLDPLNHVNNTLFNTYLEEARIRFLGEVGQMQREFDEGKTFVLVKCTIEYLKQIKYPSSVLVGSGVGEIGNTSIQALQGIYDAETKMLLGTGISTGVWFDINTERPCRLPKIDKLEEMKVVA